MSKNELKNDALFTQQDQVDQQLQAISQQEQKRLQQQYLQQLLPHKYEDMRANLLQWLEKEQVIAQILRDILNPELFPQNQALVANLPQTSTMTIRLNISDPIELLNDLPNPQHKLSYNIAYINERKQRVFNLLIVIQQQRIKTLGFTLLPSFIVDPFDPTSEGGEDSGEKSE